MKKSRKPADESRPFGYGKELYFWSFVVSILIFGLGGALSIYQGILHMIEPEVMKDPFWNYIVLVLSLIFEGTSLLIAVKEFNKTRKGLKWWDAIIKSKDPASFLVVFEDGDQTYLPYTGVGWAGIGHCRFHTGICFFYPGQREQKLIDGRRNCT